MKCRRYCHSLYTRELVRGGKIPLGRNEDESKQMLEQTAAALHLLTETDDEELSLHGMKDLTAALQVASKGRVSEIEIYIAAGVA